MGVTTNTGIAGASQRGNPIVETTSSSSQGQLHVAFSVPQGKVVPNRAGSHAEKMKAMPTHQPTAQGRFFVMDHNACTNFLLRRDICCHTQQRVRWWKCECGLLWHQCPTHRVD